MPPAAILTGASKSNATGGTFADSLSANTGDSLTVPTFPDGTAGRIVAMWAVDSDNTAEFEIFSTRTEGLHDTTNGLRVAAPSVSVGATTNTTITAFRDEMEIPVFPGDTFTIKATSTAADDLAFAFETVYDDLPGVGQAQFMTWSQVQSLYDGTMGLLWGPTASATPGAWGASRALTADDNRFQGLKWYAFLGGTPRVPVVSASFVSNVWGGQRIGFPSGGLDLNTSDWFVQRSQRHGIPLIPFFNQADALNVLGYVMDSEASTTPAYDLIVVRLKSAPTPGQ